MKSDKVNMTKSSYRRGNDYDKYYLNQRNAKLEIKEGLDKTQQLFDKLMQDNFG